MFGPRDPSTARKPVKRVAPTILVTANAAGGHAPRLSLVRGCDRSRNLMRHARLTLALPIGLLALVVILSAFCRGLVSAARCPQLLLPHSLPAAIAAIALASITTRPESEERVARPVKASPHTKALNRPRCCHCNYHTHSQNSN